MKKIIIPMFVALILGITVADAYNLTEAEVKKRAESMGIDTTRKINYDDFWRPVLIDYHKGNYLGAVSLLQKHLKKTENDPLARYYLALCYHKMGYMYEANMEYMKAIENYMKIDDDRTRNSVYANSQKAMACIDDSKSEACIGKAAAPELTDMELAQQERIKQLESQLKDMDSQLHPVADIQNEDDITRFIKSNQKIHPAAMDRVTTQRMERKLQEAEYKRKQEEANNPQ